MFRRPPPRSAAPSTPERRYQLNLIPEHALSFRSGPQHCKHLALIGEAEWTHYWFLDAIAQSQDANLTSFIVSGPADHQLRQMPLALDLPPTLVEVRSILPYDLDPIDFRYRAEALLQHSSESRLSLLFMGRDLGHVWPFILGRKKDFQNKLIFGIADVTQNLKLPLSQTFRYFLVQNTHQAQFEKAVERWHRHDTEKPVFIPSAVTGKNGILYEVKDP